MALVIHPLNDLNATLIDIFFKALHQISQNVQSANACRNNKKVFVWFGNNPLAKGGGLFSKTDAQTIVHRYR